MTSLILGAVAYDPRVVTIWEGMREHFRTQGVALDFALFSSYEVQVEQLVEGRIDIAWNENVQQKIGFLGSLRYRRFIPYDRLGTGEFSLVSRQLWEQARGYDESLVRHKIGCDVRGVAQLVAHGAQINKAGTVLHLQHPSSCVEGVRPHHGEMATVEGVPYSNDDNWGLGQYRETSLGERIWRLEGR